MKTKEVEAAAALAGAYAAAVAALATAAPTLGMSAVIALTINFLQEPISI